MLNASWMIIEKVIRAMCTLLVGAWVIRFLGAEQFGVIAYAIAAIAFLQPIASLGIEGNLIREIVRLKKIGSLSLDTQTNSDEEPSYFSIDALITSVFVLRLISGGILYVAYIFFSLVTTTGSNQPTIIIALVGFTLLCQASDTIDLLNQSELAAKRTAIAKIISYVFSNSLRLYFIYVEADVVFFAAAYLVEATIIAFILIYYYKKKNEWNLKYKTVIHFFKKFITETWPVIAAGLATAIATRMDQLLVAFYLGAEQLGMYAAAILFGTATVFLPAIICGSTMSSASKFKNIDEGKYLYILRTVYLLNISIAVFVIIVTNLFAQKVVFIFFGTDFIDSIMYLRIYSLINLPIYIGITHSIWMVNDHKLHYSLYKAIIGAVLTLSFGFVFIPIYGVIGAAVSVVSSLTICEIVISYFLNRKQFHQMLMKV